MRGWPCVIVLFDVHIFIIVGTRVQASSTDNTCAAFRFPDIMQGELTFEENTSVNLIFSLENIGCESFSNVLILVKRNTSLRCEIEVKNGACEPISASSLCSCKSKRDQFLFTRKLDRSDSTLWRWTAYENYKLVATYTISFILKSQAIVQNLTVARGVDINPSLVLKNQKVVIICLYQNSDPPTTFRLSDSNGRLLNSSSDNTGLIIHTMQEVKCLDTGILTCEGDDSENNMSVILLVECPPILDSTVNKSIRVSSNQNVNISFPIRMHAMTLNKCQLCTNRERHYKGKELTAGTVYETYDCFIFSNATNHISNGSIPIPGSVCACSLQGIVPYMAINVQLTDVRKSDTGHWRLIVGNKEGSDTMDFFLNIAEVPAVITSLTIDGNEGPDPSVVPQHKNVLVTCSWTNGKPPVPVRLLDNKGKVLQSSINSSGSFMYSYPAVQCNDFGAVRCEANGSEKNKSLLLLVECQPWFSKDSYKRTTSTVGQTVDIEFPFRAHTTEITQCNLNSEEVKRGQNPADSDTYVMYVCRIVKANTKSVRPAPYVSSSDQIQCRCRVDGTAPDLILSVRVDGLAEKDKGNWRVTLENNKGSDRLEFFLDITQEKNGNFAAFVIAASVAGSVITVVIIIVIVGICIFFVRGKIAIKQSIVRSPQERIIYKFIGLNERGAGDQSEQTSSGYEEINNIVIENEARYYNTITENNRGDGNIPSPKEIEKERLSENYLQVFNASSSIPSDGSDKMYYLHPECTSDDKTEMSGKNVTSDLDTSPSESNQEPHTGTRFTFKLNHKY